MVLLAPAILGLMPFGLGPPCFCGLLRKVDPCTMPGRGGEAAVASQQPGVEHLRKRNVNRGAGREVVPQLPDPAAAGHRADSGVEENRTNR